MSTVAEWLSNNSRTPVQRIKDELRIPQPDTGQDSLLSSLINAATDIVSTDLAVPILDRTVSTECYLPPARNVLLLNDPYFRPTESFPTISYFEDADAFYSNSRIFINDLTANKIDGSVEIRRTEPWPSMVFSKSTITYVRGVDSSDPAIQGYEQLTILMIRHLYRGNAELKDTSAYNTLLNSLRRWN